MGRLQRENEQLKAELAAVRGAPLPSLRSNSGPIASEEAPVVVIPRETVPVAVEESPVTLAPEPAAAPVAPTARSAKGSVRPSQPPASTPVRPTTPAARGGRVYTVQEHDSLYSIARKHYGNNGVGAKVQEIFNANRDTMKSEADIKPGMQLRLP